MDLFEAELLDERWMGTRTDDFFTFCGLKLELELDLEVELDLEPCEDAGDGDGNKGENEMAGEIGAILSSL